MKAKICIYAKIFSHYAKIIGKYDSGSLLLTRNIENLCNNNNESYLKDQFVMITESY